MSVFERFIRNKKNSRPGESAPVIGRGGRIGRVDVNEDLAERSEKETEKKAIGYEQTVEKGEVSISDSEFLRSAGQYTEKKSKKRRFFTVKNGQKEPFPLLTLVAMGFATVLIMSLVVNFVEVNEYTKDVAALQKKVESMEKERVELQAELDEKDSIDALRQYMEEKGNTLGMVEEDRMKAPVAITPEKNDGIEDFEVPEEEEPIVTVVLNALAKNLGDVWNKFVG